jgi:6-phosphogluconolactonase
VKPPSDLLVTRSIGNAVGSLLRDLVTQGSCRLAIPGGETVVPVFAWLAEHLVPPPELVVTWVDERHVPAAGDDWRAWSAHSNRRLAWEHWWSKTGPPREVPLDAPGTLNEALADVTHRFHAELGGIDVALLGMGQDGHLASLFPGHPALDAEGPVVAVPDAPKPPPERLSLSLATLEAASTTILVATGVVKGAVLSRMLRGDNTLPIGRYSPAGAWHWVIDPDAARSMEENG